LVFYTLLLFISYLIFQINQCDFPIHLLASLFLTKVTSQLNITMPNDVYSFSSCM